MTVIQRTTQKPHPWWVASKARKRNNPNKTELVVDEAINAACKYCQVHKTDLLSRNRFSTIAVARHLARYYMRQKTYLSYRQIAEATGAKDHTTAMNSINYVSDQLEMKNKFVVDFCRAHKLIK